MSIRYIINLSSPLSKRKKKIIIIESVSLARELSLIILILIKKINLHFNSTRIYIFRLENLDYITYYIN